MNHSEGIIIGIIVGLIIGFFGFLIFMIFLTRSYFIWPMMRSSMMPMSIIKEWNQGALKEVKGMVEEVEWMEIKLDVNEEEIEVHGPPWFWQRIGIKEGDVITVKGAFIYMMEPMGSWHQELIPFELTINDKTYGEASKGIPIWMQESK